MRIIPVHSVHFVHDVHCFMLLVLFSAFAAHAAAIPAFPRDFESWVQQRVGPVVFPEGSSHSWDELTGLATDLGTKAVKTWVGAEKPGEGLAKLRSQPYRDLIRRFPVVHFNLSFAYIAANYRDGKIDPAMLDALRDEWREITLYLCHESSRKDQIFLLSVGGEINVYLGTAGKYPDFPVAEYVNACHAAKEAGLAALKGSKKRTSVFTVAEFQGDIEYERFAEKCAPLFATDLISLSHYTFYRELDASLEILRRYVKPGGPFGEHRLMLGEYGPCLEVCNWNQAEHARWHNDILERAFKNHIQFAFFYEIADHEFVIKTGSHDGLITWSPGPTPRLAWSYYQRLYHGQGVIRPELDLYESPRAQPAPAAAEAPNLALVSVEATSEHPAAGQPISFRATVANRGNAPSIDTTVNFFADDRLFAWVWIPVLKPGDEMRIESNQGDPRFVWTARAGAHRVTAVADLLNKNAEPNKDDNRKTLWIDVPNSAK